MANGGLLNGLPVDGEGVLRGKFLNAPCIIEPAQASMDSGNMLVVSHNDVIGFTSTNRDSWLLNGVGLPRKRPAHKSDQYRTRRCIPVIHVLSPIIGAPRGCHLSRSPCRLQFDRDKPAACQHKADQRNQVKVDFACSPRLLWPEEDEQHH